MPIIFNSHQAHLNTMNQQTPLPHQIFTIQEEIDSSHQFAIQAEQEQPDSRPLFKTWRSPSSTPEEDDSRLYESYLTGEINPHDMRRGKNSCEHFLTQFQELGYAIEQIDESMDYTPEWPQNADFTFNLHPQSAHQLESLTPLPLQSPSHIINQPPHCCLQKKQLANQIQLLRAHCGELRTAEREVRSQLRSWREESRDKVQSELNQLLHAWQRGVAEIRRQADQQAQQNHQLVEEMRLQLEEAISAKNILTQQLTKSDENQQTLASRVQQLQEELALLQEHSEQLFTRNCELQRNNLRLTLAEEELALLTDEHTEQQNYLADLEEKVADLEYEQMRQTDHLESELMEYRDSMEEEFRNRWGELRSIFEHGEKVRVQIEAAHLDGLEIEAVKLKELMTVKLFLEGKIEELTQGYERTSKRYQHAALREGGVVVQLLRSLKQSVICLFRTKQTVFWTNHESLNQLNALYRQLHAYFKQNCFSHPTSRILERVPASRPPLSDSTFHSLNTTPPSRSQDNFCLQTQSTCFADPLPPPLPWGHLENSLLLITHRLQDVRQRLKDSLSASCP